MSQLLLVGRFHQLSARSIHVSSALNSVFMKKQKKIDPEIAKVREMRKRRKLERDIRLIQQEGKAPKPVTELTVDKKMKSVVDQIRRNIVVDDETTDERAVIAKAYCKSRNKLDRADSKWIQTMIREQDRALKVLKEVAPKLYESAIAVDPGFLPFSTRGPVLTPPLKNYQSPDGEYTDTTPKFVENKPAPKQTRSQT